MYPTIDAGIIFNTRERGSVCHPERSAAESKDLARAKILSPHYQILHYAQNDNVGVRNDRESAQNDSVGVRNDTEGMT